MIGRMAKNRKSDVGNRKSEKILSRRVHRVVAQNARPSAARLSRNSTAKSTISSSENIFKRRFRITRKGLVITLIIIGLLALAFYKKNWIVAATVNNAPITTLELVDRLKKQYGTQMLTQMINEKLINDEIAKNNIVVSDSELNDRIAKLEENFGGKETFDSLLAQQGQIRKDVERDLRLQIAIEKLYSSQATVSAEEVDKYIAENKETLVATVAAEQKKEAEDVLRQQKTSQIFNQKFQELKAGAKVTIF